MGFVSIRTSTVISVSTLGPGRKELMNQGDFQAEGDSILLLNGVSPKLQARTSDRKQFRIGTSTVED